MKPSLLILGALIEAIPATQLFDRDADPGETTDLAARHPDVVAALMPRVELARTELGDYDRVGHGARFFEDGPKRPDMRKASENDQKRKLR